MRGWQPVLDLMARSPWRVPKAVARRALGSIRNRCRSWRRGRTAIDHQPVALSATLHAFAPVENPGGAATLARGGKLVRHHVSCCLLPCRGTNYGAGLWCLPQTFIPSAPPSVSRKALRLRKNRAVNRPEPWRLSAEPTQLANRSPRRASRRTGAAPSSRRVTGRPEASE